MCVARFSAYVVKINVVNWGSSGYLHRGHWSFGLFLCSLELPITSRKMSSTVLAQMDVCLLPVVWFFALSMVFWCSRHAVQSHCHKSIQARGRWYRIPNVIVSNLWPQLNRHQQRDSSGDQSSEDVALSEYNKWLSTNLSLTQSNGWKRSFKVLKIYLNGVKDNLHKFSCLKTLKSKFLQQYRQLK